MPNCFECTHATRDEFETREPAHRQVTCSKIREALEIHLVTGYDGGYVDSIECDATFSCGFWEPREGLIDLKLRPKADYLESTMRQALEALEADSWDPEQCGRALSLMRTALLLCDSGLEDW